MPRWRTSHQARMPRSSSVIGARSSRCCIRTCTGCKRTVRLCEGGPRSSACCKRLAYPGAVLAAQPPAQRGTPAQRAARVLAVDMDLDARAAPGTQRWDQDQARFLGDGLGEHLLVLAVRPAAVLVMGQEPAGPGDPNDILEQARGDGSWVDGTESGHVRGGHRGLQPVPPESHGGTILVRPAGTWLRRAARAGTPPGTLGPVLSGRCRRGG